MRNGDAVKTSHTLLCSIQCLDFIMKSEREVKGLPVVPRAGSTTSVKNPGISNCNWPLETFSEIRG